MDKFIAATTTLIIVGVVGYLLVVAPWVVGAVLILIAVMIIAWIFIMALYTGMLSLLETLDLDINRRRVRRRNGEVKDRITYQEMCDRLEMENKFLINSMNSEE